MAWYRGDVWQPRVGAACSRKDDPRHEGTIVRVDGAMMKDGAFLRSTAKVRWTSGVSSIESVDDLCEAGDDTYWHDN